MDATLAEVLTGRHPGRTSPDEITVNGGVGLPFMDLAVAWPVYQPLWRVAWARASTSQALARAG